MQGPQVHWDVEFLSLIQMKTTCNILGIWSPIQKKETALPDAMVGTTLITQINSNNNLVTTTTTQAGLWQGWKILQPWATTIPVYESIH